MVGNKPIEAHQERATRPAIAGETGQFVEALVDLFEQADGNPWVLINLLTGMPAESSISASRHLSQRIKAADESGEPVPRLVEVHRAILKAVPGEAPLIGVAMRWRCRVWLLGRAAIADARSGPQDRPRDCPA